MIPRLSDLQVVLVLACSLSIQSAFAQEKLSVEDGSQGCFHSNVAKIDFRRIGNEYVSPQKSVSVTDVDRLLAALRVEKKQLDLNDIGITRASVEQHRNDVLKAIRAYDVSPAKAESGDEFGKFYDWNNVAVIATSSVMVSPRSTTHVWVKIEAKDKNGKVVLAARSDNPIGYMLPWRIKEGTAPERKSYSIEIGKALAAIADSKGPNFKYFNGQEYWQKEFWNGSSESNLVEIMRQRIEDSSGTRLAASIPGFDRVAKDFELQDARVGDYMAGGYSMWVTLKSKQQAGQQTLLDEIRWNVPVSEKTNKVGADWSEFLKEYQQAAEIIRRHQWLGQLRKSDPKVKASVELYADPARFKDDFVTNERKAWTKLGMKGAPALEVSLTKSRPVFATVMMSKEDNRALVDRADGGNGEHWLEKEVLDDDQYFIVQPDGQHQFFGLNGKTKRIKEKPKWF